MHDLRHTLASLSNGKSLAYVKEHFSIKVTVDIYQHLVPDANRDAVAKSKPKNDLNPHPRHTQEKMVPGINPS